jgi:uncharacterized protein
MTAAKLQDKRVRDLARMAKQSGVPGWHAMRKDELIIALTCRATKAIDKTRNLTVRGTDDAKKLPIATEQPSASLQEDHHSIKNQLRPARKVRVGNPVDRKVVIQRVRDFQAQQSQEKSLATKQEPKLKHHTKRNRLVVLVRGPHWLHAFWEITESTIKRVQASMREQWHTAKPILRLLDSPENNEESAVERVIREIEIHGGVKNWFIDLRQPMSCRVEIGYKSRCGDFYRLCKSNHVSAAPPDRKDSLSIHWKDIDPDFSKIFSLSGGYSKNDEAEEVRNLFQEHLGRPLLPPKPSQQALDHTHAGEGVEGFPLEIKAEVSLLGSTEKGARVSIQGEPLNVADDGSFRIRIDMPNRRQVIPISALSASGLEHQTLVVAVERNTRLLESQPTSETREP